MSNPHKKRGTHKWSLDFTGSRSGSNRQVSTTDGSMLTAPVGYRGSDVAVSSDTSKTDPEQNQKLIDKRSWDIALAPLKQIPMNFFIMWMAGNTISIFPIMMVGMMFFKPIQAFISIQQTFNMIEGSNALLQKLVYMFGNAVCLALAVYKCQVMGLLPTHASDWLAFIEQQKRMEWSGGGMGFM